MWYPMPKEDVNDVEFYANLGKDERVYLIEECAELIQALTKSMRGTVGTKWRTSIAMEMAHVYLAMNHVREQLNISLGDIQDRMDDKIDARPLM